MNSAMSGGGWSSAASLRIGLAEGALDRSDMGIEPPG
jgi:hypothetical protein